MYSYIVNWIRGFSNQEIGLPPARNVEDAPFPMRQELLDAIYLVAGQSRGALDGDRDFYFVISQSLGVQASGNPYAGRRYAIGRDLQRADWPRVYDVIVRLWPEFQRVGFEEIYRVEVNRILAAYGVAWDFGADGGLYRVLPAAAHAQINAAFVELSAPRYAPALALFNSAGNAFEARPRRDRDACANMFDALESVAKEKFAMPRDTFGAVVAHIRATNALNPQITGVLEGLNTLRNRNFGHGMAAPFGLSAAEVDFTFLSCIAGILLITRLP
jgi:hypothetical protein